MIEGLELSGVDDHARVERGGDPQVPLIMAKLVLKDHGRCRKTRDPDEARRLEDHGGVKGLEIYIKMKGCGTEADFCPQRAKVGPNSHRLKP